MCSFVTKTRIAASLGVTHILVVSGNGVPVVAMPAGAGELSTPVTTGAAMASHDVGNGLLGVASTGMVKARVIATH